jgi:hypothetical protein
MRVFAGQCGLLRPNAGCTTLLPTNRALHATAIDSAGPETRRLIEKWGRLHAARTAFGMAGTFAFLWALNA